MATKTAPTSCRDAISAWEKRTGQDATTAERVELWGQCPPIEKMDAGLAGLTACRHLALSTNAIDRIAGLAPLTSLDTLSLARNGLRRLDGVEAAAGSLTQLWVSYNALERLASVEALTKLRVLMAMHNRIGSWAEVERLAALPGLEEVGLVGNPIAAEGGGGVVAAATAPAPPAPGASPTTAAAPSAAAPSSAPASLPYRIEVLRRLPRLVKLDGAPVTGAERAAAAAAGLVGPAAAAAAAAKAAAASTTPPPPAAAPASPAVLVAV